MRGKRESQALSLFPARAGMSRKGDGIDWKKIRRLIVTDDREALLGIITRADILKAVIRKLK